VAANSQDKLRDTIWPEIGKWHRQLPEALKAIIDVQAERIVVVQDPEGAFAVRRTASKDNPEALQGFHAEHLLFLIDEASSIPDIVSRSGWGLCPRNAYAFTSLVRSLSCLLLFENPTHDRGCDHAAAHSTGAV
jgi:hypothetical protein